MKRLVLCVEGDGDFDAMPILVNKLLAALPPELQGVVYTDTKPLKVGEIAGLTGQRQDEWLRYLEIAKRRKPLGAVLLVIDGDTKDKVKIEGQSFCAARVGRILAERAQHTGAGRLYSVGVVILRQEFESLLIASYASLPGNRPEVILPEEPEEAPRGAKEWLGKNLEGGYKETQHQAPLTRAIDLDRVRTANLRSFRRLEKAVLELVVAVQSGTHVATPTTPTTLSDS